MLRKRGRGIWELPLEQPITSLADGRIRVEVKDREGNLTVIDRRFSVSNQTAAR